MNNSYGYTLIEVLVAVMLGSAIIALLSGASWMLASGRWSNPDSEFTLYSADFDRLTRILKGSLKIDSPGRFPFIVDPDNKLLLSATFSQGGKQYPKGPSDVATVKLQFEPGSGLLVELDNGFFEEGVEKYQLFRGITAVSLLCCDRDGNWQTRWLPAEDQGFPVAIRIQIQYPGRKNSESISRTIILPVSRNAV